MSNDDDWVSNVKRWCQDQRVAAAAQARASSSPDEDGDMLGYEAAQPMWQAPHWPGSQGD